MRTGDAYVLNKDVAGITHTDFQGKRDRRRTSPTLQLMVIDKERMWRYGAAWYLQGASFLNVTTMKPQNIQ